MRLTTRTPDTHEPPHEPPHEIQRRRPPPHRNRTDRNRNAMQLTGAQALIKSLEMQHVEVIFGLPGGAILPVYDPILDSSIRHVLVRHEQGAGHMAEGYAHVTGRPGVAMVTSGPGATNIVTPAGRRHDGLDPHRRDHRPGGHHGHRHRRLPGVPHHRRHHGHHQAQLARHRRPGHAASDRRGLPRRHHRPPRPGPRRRPQGRLQRARWTGTGRRRLDELDLPGYNPQTEGDPRAGPPGRRADPAPPAPGHLRRRAGS